MATTIDTYYPFDSGAGSSITEAEWRAMMALVTPTGVVDLSPQFVVEERAAGANMSVDVDGGTCLIRGHYGNSASTVNLSISDGDGSNDRIDRIVLRADFTNNRIELDVLEGTPAGSPSAPSLTQSSTKWEISLAQILVPTGETTSIDSGDITDERPMIYHSDGIYYGAGSSGVGDGTSTGMGVGASGGVLGPYLRSEDTIALRIKGAQILAESNGSAALPSYTFLDDQTTGMWLVANNILDFAADESSIAQVLSTGVRPGSDNTYDLGESGRRWDDVYATNGTIQTSDVRVKHNVEALPRGLAVNAIKSLADAAITFQRTPGGRVHSYFDAAQVGAALQAKSAAFVDPRVADPTSTDPLGVRDHEITPWLVKALDAAIDMIQSLQARVDALEA